MDGLWLMLPFGAHLLLAIIDSLVFVCMVLQNCFSVQCFHILVHRSVGGGVTDIVVESITITYLAYSLFFHLSVAIAPWWRRG